MYQIKAGACLFGVAILLVAAPAGAEQALPELPQLYEHAEPDTLPRNAVDKAGAGLKLLEYKLKEYSRMELTDDSEFHLRRNGFRVETRYSDEWVGEFEARDGGDVSFQLRFSF